MRSQHPTASVRFGDPRLPEMAWRKLFPMESGCWLWAGVTFGNGYGEIKAHGVNTLLHRFVYERLIGPIPNGAYVCHSCDVKLCANPAHLWAGTAADNNRDMVAKDRHFQKNQTHCKRGHKFTPENTYRAKPSPARPWFQRVCRSCYRARRHLMRLKKKQSKA